MFEDKVDLRSLREERKILDSTSLILAMTEGEMKTDTEKRIEDGKGRNRPILIEIGGKTILRERLY